MRNGCAAVLFAWSSLAFGQVTWQYSYGGFSTDEGSSVVATTDGRYLVVGSTGSFGAGGGDIYVLMLDADGQREWSRTLGGVNVEQGRQVKETLDGGFILVGCTNSFGSGGYDGYVVKLDGTGAIEWEREFGGIQWDFFHSVAVCSNGSYAVAGETFSSGEGASDAWLLKLTGDGGLAWERTYGGSEVDMARCVIQLDDGGFVLAGAATNAGDQDAWLIRTLADGDTLWTALEGGDSLDFAVSVINTNDGGFAAVGTTHSFNDVTEGYHFKVDANGGFMWEKNWGQVNDQETAEQKELPNGDLVSVGYVNGGGSGGLDMFILFTDANGEFQAGITNGGDNGTEDEVGMSIDLAQDGGFILCGYTKSFGFGPKDVYVVKTDSVGLTETIAVIEEFDPLTVGEAERAEQLIAYPNPCSGSITIDDAQRWERIELITAEGRTLRSWTQQMSTLDLSGIADGCYLLIASDANKSRAIAPLIIQNR